MTLGRWLASVLLILVAWLATAAAQQPAPRSPTLRNWSADGQEPRWRARIEAHDDHIESVSVLQHDADGAVLAIRESKAEKETTYIERRDRAGLPVWRHPVPGLPERYAALNVFAVEGKTKADLTLVAAFNPTDPAPDGVFGKVIDVDIRAGTLRVVGGFTYPSKPRLTADDWMELSRAKVLPSGLIVFYGGIGSGPFSWWVGLRKPDGRVVWDVVSTRSLGHVVDLRPDGDGVEVSVVQIMSSDHERGGLGSFRVRIDAAGRVIGSVRLWRRESAPRFMADGGLTYLVHAETGPATIVVIDRLGRRRFTRTIPGDAHQIVRSLDDGTIVVDRADSILLLAPDGDSAIVVRNKDYDTRLLVDGTIEVSRCEDDRRACKVRSLSLFNRPR